MRTPEEVEKCLKEEQFKIWRKDLHYKYHYRKPYSLFDLRNMRKVTYRKIIELPLVDAINELLGLAGGDDYDGVFTHSGDREYRVAYRLLIARINELESRTEVKGEKC